MAHLGDSPTFLIGYRGTGKTSVGRDLASRLGYEFVDADHEIEQEAGRTIAQIFADQGEPAFRDLEASIVDSVARKLRMVVALGGGAVLREENRRAVCKAGPVVWLTASVDTILARVAIDPTTSSRRPNLTVGGREEVEQLLAVRTPLYAECATLTVDTEGKTSAEVADEIIARL
jgi:shikimate kinase